MTQKFCLTGFETDRLEEGWTGSSWDTFDERSCLKEKHNKQKSLIFNVCMQKIQYYPSEHSSYLKIFLGQQVVQHQLTEGKSYILCKRNVYTKCYINGTKAPVLTDSSARGQYCLYHIPKHSRVQALPPAPTC